MTYAEWRRRPETENADYGLQEETLRRIVDNALQRGGGWLDPSEVEHLLRAAGIETPGGEMAASADEAFEAAVRMARPVALKASGPSLLHKSDRGGVKLSLQNECEVRDAFLEMKARLGDDMSGAFVQPMVNGGVEVMLGATDDPTFGHVLAFGAGGTLVELLADVAFRIHPITEGDAEDMIQQVRISRMLAGIRGAAPSDVPALREAVMRLSAMIDICPEIRELDINPLKVLENGVIALDARVRVERHSMTAIPFPAARSAEDLEIEAFERLKPQLGRLWDTVFPGDKDAYTSVIVPSLSLDRDEMAKIAGITFYEERLLFLLMRLRNPRARLIYVTSQPIHPMVLDYYLQLLVGIPASHARARLTLLCAYDSSPRSLTEKILERPRLMDRIAAAIGDPIAGIPDRLQRHSARAVACRSPWRADECNGSETHVLGIEVRQPSALPRGRCRSPIRSRGPSRGR